MLFDDIEVFEPFAFESLCAACFVRGEVAEEYFPCLRSVLWLRIWLKQ